MSIDQAVARTMARAHDRIVFEAKPKQLEPIDWPAAFAPHLAGKPPSELPAAPVLLITWTAAEGQALADVMTPGHPLTAWNHYTTGWVSYESQLTGRSPARESQCLGKWAVTEIAGKLVVLFKSELHLSTDGPTMPVRQLVRQLVHAVGPELVITTGTAGGIGADTVLGDVAIANAAKFNCKERFEHEAFAQARYVSEDYTAGPNVELAFEKLIPANAVKLPKELASRVPKLMLGDVETMDFFGFDDAEDSYGVVANDPNARTEEMDDAAVALALEELGTSVRWLSVRNASDPMMAKMKTLEEESKAASRIYEDWGYLTTVGSAITCAAIIGDLL